MTETIITPNQIDHTLQILEAKQGEGAEPNTSDLEKCGDLIHTAQTCNNTIDDVGSEKDKI